MKITNYYYRINSALRCLLFAAFVLLTNSAFSQGAAVNTSGAAADPSAMLDVSSNNSGMLIPRMTSAERNAIANPAIGLMIFNTSTMCFEFYAYGVWQTGNCGIASYNCGINTVTFTYNNNSVTYGTVTGENGTCWLNRNLGSSSVATSYNDINGYGDLFQWGRLDDGHQLRTSGTTTTQSSTYTPGHSNFIRGMSNWYSGANPDILWQGTSGINNPCPIGWRVPTETEITNESLSWINYGGINYTGAFASPLKWTAAGYRNTSWGAFFEEGDMGYYWSSTVAGTGALYLGFNSSNASMNSQHRSNACSVRCILD